MIIKNKKNGTNVLAFRDGVANVRVIIKGGAVVNIPHLKDLSQVINKSDFLNSRGWFEIVKETEINKSIYIEATEEILNTEELDSIEQTELEKAEKEVNEYTSINEQTNNKK